MGGLLGISAGSLLRVLADAGLDVLDLVVLDGVGRKGCGPVPGTYSHRPS